MGPFQGFGSNWDQVPNLGHHYEHCSCYLDFFFSETKFSETETETFFRYQIFLKPKPRLFLKPNFLKPRLFSETKLFRKEIRDFFRSQIFRNRNPQRFGKIFETENFRNRNVNLCLWVYQTNHKIVKRLSHHFNMPKCAKSVEHARFKTSLATKMTFKVPIKASFLFLFCPYDL